MRAAAALGWMYLRNSGWTRLCARICWNHQVSARVVLVAMLLVSSPLGLSAQPVDVVHPASPSTLRATDASPARGVLTALPLQNFSVAHGIGVLEDDGNTYWPGFPAKLQAPATFHFTPTTSNTFMVQRVAYQFDDPAQGSVLYDGSVRPILGFLDANYIRYTLPAPFSIGGKQYTTLSISTWGAVAFGNADSTQVNYDPTVVSSMFHIPIAAVWYELFYYPSTARIITRVKAHSVVITWQNLLSRHSQTPCTFQVELFTDTGELQMSYQSLPVDDGLVGVNTGTETFSRQTANGVSATDIPTHLQATNATFDDYGGTLAGITLTLKAPVPTPDAATNESFNYTLVLNGQDAFTVAVFPNQAPYTFAPSPKIPDFPIAQIDTWELKLNGNTISLRVPATSLEPYLNASGINTWSIKSVRNGGAGFISRTVTETLPLALTVRHALLPSQTGAAAIEVPAQVFHYMPGVWDTDRIRESIAAYLVSRGQNVDTFRFFPTIYDDGLRHSNYAGTYPRQSNVGGAGQIPARTECDCHYGAEFSALAESLGDEATTQVALTHELGHECTFYADYRDVNGNVIGPWRGKGIPCTGGAHPDNGLINTSMFADDQSTAATMSVMGGSLSGNYFIGTPRFGFSRVEMYFLGLASASEVTPVTFVQGSTSQQITIDQVIAANGPRTPSYTGQNRIFRVPTFVVKRKGETIDDGQMQQLDNLLSRWRSRFWRETGGRARANLTLDGSCGYTLSATSASVAPTATTGSIRVLAESGCAWTASSSDNWITITSGSSGSSDGQVNYAAAANPAGVSRTGTITIAGQSVTVHQAAPRRRSARPR